MIINRINDVLTKPISPFELLLNLSFILIISIIIFILYWHFINRSIAKINRCKINLNSQGSVYNLYAYHGSDKIYNINYDNTTNRNASINCSCPSGNIPNKFNIPIYNSDIDKTEIINKYCSCDKYYNTTEKNKVYYDGDNFLINYYSTNYNNELSSLINQNLNIKFPSA